MRDRWLNPPEWVAWLDEPVPGYPKRPVPRDEDAAKALKIRAMVVPARTEPTLQRRVREHVAAGSALFSDELSSDQGLDALYAHGVINHAVQYGVRRLIFSLIRSSRLVDFRCLWCWRGSR